jgi:ferredoxin-NADP reductase
VDGPFGTFTLDREAASAEALVLIAGGIGIAPIRSLLLTLADRGDRRAIYLFYAVRDPGRVICGADLDALRERLNLDLVYVFERPGADWPGERGRLDEDTLRRHLPAGLRRFHYFVCGPAPMMAATEKALLKMGVPAAAINTERFDMV